MSKNLKISREIAVTIYEEQNEQGKTLLQKMWPDEFIPKLITDRVKTIEDAYHVTGKQKIGYPADYPKHKINLDYLEVINEALNEGWKPNWSDSNEYKYTPYFTFKAGFGFSYTFYGSWYTNTCVGSRLVFKTRELAIYAGTQFQSIYNDYLTIQ